MDEVQDPLRGNCWNKRPWRDASTEQKFYFLEDRPGLGLPDTFDFDQRRGKKTD